MVFLITFSLAKFAPTPSCCSRVNCTGRDIHKNVPISSFLNSKILKITKQENEVEFALSDSKNTLL